MRQNISSFEYIFLDLLVTVNMYDSCNYIYETSNILIIKPKDLLNDILIPYQLGDKRCKISLRKTMTSVIFLK